MMEKVVRLLIIGFLAGEILANKVSLYLFSVFSVFEHGKEMGEEDKRG